MPNGRVLVVKDRSRQGKPLIHADKRGFEPQAKNICTACWAATLRRSMSLAVTLFDKARAGEEDGCPPRQVSSADKGSQAAVDF
jgi:hypothetical protein